MNKENQESLQQRVKELDELIELAEKISKDISIAKTKANRVTVSILTFFALLPFGYLYYMNFSDYSNSVRISSILLVVLVILIFYSMVILSSQRRRVRFMEYREGELLERLFDMISTHKQSLEQELGIVSKAIYEMRLSRIRFHFPRRKFPNTPFDFIIDLFSSFKDI